MKYKNRKDTKRKYTQAILATVATMTLGVSTLGSTASAFAEENKVNIQKAPSVSATDGPVFKKEKDGSFTVLNDKIFNMETLKAIGSLGGAGLKQAYADSQVDGGNFNNTFRTLAMGSAALIPYGGVVLSPLIGLLWSEDKTAEVNQWRKLMESVAAQTHEQIAKYNNAKLSQVLQDLKEKVAEFEKIVPIPGNGSYYSDNQLGDYENIQISAKNLNNFFRTAISACQTEGYKESELPIYIILATAHMNFMNYVIENGEDLLKFKPSVLKSEFTDKQNGYTSGYIKYVTRFAEKDLDMANRVERDLQDLVRKRNEASNEIDRNLRTHTMNLIIQGASLKLETTLNKSINNIAFKQAAGIKSEWTLNQNGRPFYYDLKGQMQTGWKEISTSFATKYDQGPINGDWGNPLKHESLKKLIPYSWYYFSPEKTDTFEKGEMYSGTTQTIKGKTYRFNQEGKCLNPDGQPTNDWVQFDNRWYYFSPEDSTKNTDGVTFKKGAMVTGSVHINNKLYQFNSRGECKNPNSTDSVISDGTYKIVYSKANKVVDFGYDGNEHPVIWDYHDGKNQQWEFKYDADKNAYQIINKADDRVLAYNTSGASDTALVTHNGHKREHYWTLEDVGDGNVLLVNYANKNKVLDVYGEKTASGARLYVQDKLKNSNAQKFKLVKVE
ncbi:insecticidal delta-endotoxin Cry8Ea1 family protein [Bacillus toyonensis]|uniref:insecticidal delta-endotoxin Cry8Ea1 family protein n=1 Tax=Bacillus toyonensis TaxID=155322 RepID=UPI003D64E5AD